MKPASGAGAGAIGAGTVMEVLLALSFALFLLLLWSAMKLIALVTRGKREIRE